MLCYELSRCRYAKEMGGETEEGSPRGMEMRPNISNFNMNFR